jgi:hypothetical protein
MADVKISQLPTETATSPTDLIPIVSETGPTTKAITQANFEASLTIANQVGGAASGTGNLVRVTSPTLVTPNIGAATATSVNDTTIPSSKTLVDTVDVQTITNKRITRRFVTVTQSATPSIDTDNGDIFSITGLAQAITSMTSGLTGTPSAGDLMMIQITDNGTARGLTFGTSFGATTIALPTTTVISTLLRMLFQYNPTNSKWEIIAQA